MTELEAIESCRKAGWHFDDLNTEWVGPKGERVLPYELRSVMEKLYEKENTRKQNRT